MGKSNAQKQAERQAAAEKNAAQAAAVAPAPGGVPPLEKSAGAHELPSAQDPLIYDEDDAEAFHDAGIGMHKGIHGDTMDASLNFGDQIHTDGAPMIWKPPAHMEAPAPRPGMVQRWIRMSLKGKADPQNVSMQGGNGWRPRGLDTVPAGERSRYPTTRDARTGGICMVNGDAILCEMPVKLFDQMATYYQNKAKSQVDAIGQPVLDAAAVKGSKAHGFGAPRIVEDTREQVNLRRTPQAAAD